MSQTDLGVNSTTCRRSCFPRLLHRQVTLPPDMLAKDSSPVRNGPGRPSLAMALTTHAYHPCSFECLQVIAAHGPAGILQPDLRKITGQDKRSLPSRTDSLAKAGYITKEQVIAKGSNTAILKLRRFVKDGATSGPHHVRAYSDVKTSAAETSVLNYDAWYDQMMKVDEGERQTS